MKVFYTAFILMALQQSWAEPLYPDTLCLSSSKSFEKILSQLKQLPAVEAEAKRLALKALSLDLKSESALEEVLASLKKVNDQNQLKPLVAGLVNELKKSPYGNKLPASMSELEVTEMLYFMFDQELTFRGLGKDPSVKALKTWDQIDKEVTQVLDASGAQVTGTKEFDLALEKISKAQFMNVSEAQVLSKAPHALQERIQLFKNAKKSIHVLTWAMYGDRAGEIFAKLLIRKHQQGIDVKVMCDFLTAQKTGYKESLTKLKKAGVPVIEWKGIENPFFGQHRKMAIVDGMSTEGAVVGGGRNLGDVYLHTGAEGVQKWADTDVLFKGEAVLSNQKIFADLWNEQIAFQKINTQPISIEKPLFPSFGSENKVLTINHSPGRGEIDLIYAATLKSIRSAQKNIDIENAYIILTPTLKRELIAAHRRGVKIRVFSNSTSSVDEPVVSVPIANSLKELFEEGIEVYVKVGDTLHSKVFRVDDSYAGVMSYNFHPRSSQIEGEVLHLFKGREMNQKISASIERNLKDAQKINRVSDLNIPKETTMVDLLTGVFFNAL